MADTYAVFINPSGTPWVSESLVRDVDDPFQPDLDPNTFFEIEDWSMDVEQTLHIGSTATGAGAGKVTFNPFSITRKIDRVSPRLFVNACAGSPFKFVDLIQLKSVGGETARATYLAWRFRLVAVKTVSWSYDDESPKETVSFEYGGLEMDYFQQNPNGSFGKAIHGGWDRVKNVQIP